MLLDARYYQSEMRGWSDTDGDCTQIDSLQGATESRANTASSVVSNCPAAKS